MENQEASFSEETKAVYTIERVSAGNYRFTPKSNVNLLDPAAFTVGSFLCDVAFPTTAITLSRPSFNLSTGNPQVQFIFDPLAGRVRFFFSANPSLTINSGNQIINSNFDNVSLACVPQPPLVTRLFDIFGILLT